MGMITHLMALLFGERNIVKDTVEVFRENAEGGAVRAHEVQMQAMIQFGSEFAHQRRGLFDRFVDALNRIPRPAMAIGVLALFVSAMTSPIWFSERMQGLALVPEPLWWLLGVVVSFYFGARHQAKAQDFQREIASRISAVPDVISNIEDLRALDRDPAPTERTPGVAHTGTDAKLEIAATNTSTGNAALDEWKANQA
ncbi:holin family protein [Tateyamaria sp. syn59]|uniref:holin family protein n=1 Tax=Tateyamaria sp. syn59 TaxID=2576942 RepID=UPI0016757F5F|nr:holin family protein [Tateyamaria sp. syn59]